MSQDRAARACARTSHCRTCRAAQTSRSLAGNTSSYFDVTVIASCAIASERSVGFCAELDALDHGGTVAEPIHLLAGQHDTHRALQRERRKHGEHHLILRAQPGAEGAAHERRHDPHIIRLDAEHVAYIALYVLHALRLVVDRELAATVPDHRRGIQFHRVVMLDRDIVFALVARRGCGERRLDRAARLWNGERALARLCRGFQTAGFIALAPEVGGVRLFVVLHQDQRRREARDLRLFGDDQGDRLAAEPNPVVVERAERRAVGRHIVRVGTIAVCHARTVLVRQHVDHAVDAQRLGRVDAHDSALGDG